MPWHDVHICIYGESAQDLARHFIEYWNHAKIDYEGTKNKKEGTFLKPIKKTSESLQASSTTHIQDDSSDSDDFANSESQGILGKGMQKYDINEIIEESEGSLYKTKKQNREEEEKKEENLRISQQRDSVQMKLDKISSDHKHISIHEVEEIDEDEEDKDPVYVEK